jgi:hypothetical protein
MFKGWEEAAPPAGSFIGEPKGGLIPGRKQKSENQLSLFFFSKVVFNSFWNFRFLKNAKDEKSNMLWKSIKTKLWIFW